MNKRLKIITIAVSVIYAVIFIGNTYREMIGFRQGFKLGWNEGREYAINEKLGLPITKTFFVSLKPEDGPYTFPTTTLNQVPVKAEIKKMSIQATYMKEEVPKGLRIAEGWAIFLVFPVLLYIIVMIPIQVFRIVHSVTKNKVFDPWNINRLRKIGNALLIFYVVCLAWDYFSYRIATHVVHVEGYSLQIDWGNITLILLGLVMLMFAEVLKVSVKLKEEQDLTV
ncbi:MAG: DUF2975 domain-containing protein [Bacteroidales bacterium]|jgi:hypothetical protein|nr:DUF2975 domain-containing protein [Bacteroidales bacterium]